MVREDKQLTTESIADGSGQESNCVKLNEPNVDMSGDARMILARLDRSERLVADRCTC